MFRRASALAVLSLTLAACGASTAQTEVDGGTSPDASLARLETPGAAARPVVVGRVGASARAVARDVALAVSLPALASEPFELTAGALRVRLRLHGARSVASRARDGAIAYAGGAPLGGDVVVRTRDGAFEDFVHYPTPAKDGARYELALDEGIAGLRLVDDTLELLDAGGAPRLRMEPPYVVDARGARTAAHVALEGCAYDASAAPPWARPVVRPGATRCALAIKWPGALPHPLVLDPTWTTTGNWSVGRQLHTATSLTNGRVLVAGGLANSSTTPPSCEIYDPGSGTWAKTGAMILSRSEHAAVLLGDGRVLVAGQAGFAAAAEIWSPVSGLWSATGAPKQSRSQPTLTPLLDGRVLLFGGREVNVFAGDPLSTAEIWSSTAGTWTSAASAPEQREMHTATRLDDGRVLVVGGRAPLSAVLGSATLFDPVAGTWSPSFAATTRFSHSANKLGDGRVLIAGGYKVPYGRGAEIYDPALGSFVPGGTMLEVPFDHGAITLPDGDVLLVGGSTSLGETATAQLFSPGANDVWTKLPDMSRSRSTLTLNALPSVGDSMRALVAGPSAKVEMIIGTRRASACAADEDCMTGHCEDGICCDTACGGCRACLSAKRPGGPDGECRVVTSGADPDLECPAQAVETCGRVGGCDGAGACSLHSKATPCGAIACSYNSFYDTYSEQRPSCDGAGKCDPHTRECPRSWSSCQDGIGCFAYADAGTSADTGAVDTGASPDTGLISVCLDAATLQTPSGGTRSCAPYRCLGGYCLGQCYGDGECVNGTRCAAGACVTPSSGGAKSSGGCATGGSAGEPTAAAIVFASVVAGALLARRSRKRG